MLREVDEGCRQTAAAEALPFGRVVPKVSASGVWFAIMGLGQSKCGCLVALAVVHLPSRRFGQGLLRNAFVRVVFCPRQTVFGIGLTLFGTCRSCLRPNGARVVFRARWLVYDLQGRYVVGRTKSNLLCEGAIVHFMWVPGLRTYCCHMYRGARNMPSLKFKRFVLGGRWLLAGVLVCPGCMCL